MADDYSGYVAQVRYEGEAVRPSRHGYGRRFGLRRGNIGITGRPFYGILGLGKDIQGTGGSRDISGGHRGNHQGGGVNGVNIRGQGVHTENIEGRSKP